MLPNIDSISSDEDGVESLSIHEFLLDDPREFLDSAGRIFGQKPRVPVKRAAEILYRWEVGMGGLRPAVLDPERSTVQVQAWIERISTNVQKVGGGMPASSSPVMKAREIAGYWVRKAAVAGYHLQHQEVLEALAVFIMAIATDGFEDEDRPGTQIGSSISDFGTFNSDKFGKY